MTKDENKAIRNAAILVAALDVQSADALLDGMDAEMAARVRACVMNLDDVDPDEERAVIEQFLGRGQAPQSETPASAPIESPAAVLETAVSFDEFLNSRSNETASSDDESSSASTETEDTPDQEATPFRFLNTTPHETLLRVLRNEHPQAVAVVLAHVAPKLAAAVLERLPVKLQANITRRIIHLEPVHDDTLRELEKGLVELIGSELLRSGSRTGVSTMRNILSAAAQGHRRAIVSNIDENDAALLLPGNENSESADPVSPPHTAASNSTAKPARLAVAMEFTDLGKLNDADLGRVLHKAGGRVLLLALAGASDELMTRVYGQLPRREAGLLRRQIEQQGPILLRDVEAAQQRLARLAGLMADEGTIKPPPEKRFAVAV